MEVNGSQNGLVQNDEIISLTELNTALNRAKLQ